METQKIINLLNNNDLESEKFATRKWYIINDTNNKDYGGLSNKDPSTVKFETKVLKPNLCDYSDAYILVTGTITVAGGNANTTAAFKNCAPFEKCAVRINDEHIEEANNLDIIAPMYSLIEYSDNYQDTSATLYQYKRDEPPDANADNVSADNSSSFKYKTVFLGNTADNGTLDNAKIVVPLKYVSNIFRALEMPLINCKIHLELTWRKDCVLSTAAGETIFQMTDTKLYVPVVTLSAKDNTNFIKQQNEGFKRSVYWNEYRSEVTTQAADAINAKKFLLDPFFQGVNRLFVLAFNDQVGDNRVTRDGHQKYFPPRVDIKKNYNVMIIQFLIRYKNMMN